MTANYLQLKHGRINAVDFNYKLMNFTLITLSYTLFSLVRKNFLNSISF